MSSPATAPATTPTAGPVTWVVGARGLLGRAIVAELDSARAAHRATAVPWHSHVDAVAALRQTAAELAAHPQAWRLVWAAGAGVVATDPRTLQAEVDTFERFLSGLDGLVRPPEAVFLASSAGGVHAGSVGSPYDEHTLPVPLAPYGEAKLAMERHLQAYAARNGTRAVLGRFTNLYGPGQDLSKPQGLVSQLCRAQLQRSPLGIYVPLDTARDYLFVADAARMALGVLDRAGALPAGAAQVKILGSGRATTIAALLGELRRITKRSPNVVLGSSPAARFQTRDLRFRSVVWRDLDRLATTPLPAGIHATLNSVSRQLRAAG